MLSMLDFAEDQKINEMNDWTNEFRSAFERIGENGGGVLTIPSGTYRTGPWDLPGNIDLILEEGAFVQFIPDFDLYPPVFTRWEGVECFGLHPLILAKGKQHITIRGKGVIDGSGQVWWDAYRGIRKSKRTEPQTPLELELANLNPDYKNQASGGGGRELQFLRPPLLQFFDCQDVVVEGITLQNSPFWNTHPVYSTHLRFSGVTFRNPANAPNTDGLDIDSCRDVLVQDCLFDVGDDCLVVKSGAGQDGIRVNRASEDIQVDRCKMMAGHGGIVIGSETAGGVRNLKVSNCEMFDTDRGIRIKTRRGRGGVLENLSFSDILIHGCKCPVVINSYYRCGADVNDPVLFDVNPRPRDSSTPRISGVTIQNMQATGCRSSAGFIAGLPESPITDLSIDNYYAEMSEPELLEPIEESAMYAGLPHTDDRGIRILYAQNPFLNRVM